MSARLYNHTKVSDDILRDILNFAARCAGVKGDVPAKLTYSTYIQPSAFAQNVFPYRKTLIGKPTTSKDKRTLDCPVGYIEVHLPERLQLHWMSTTDRDTNALAAAEWFVDICIHEMRHIHQFRTGWKPPEFYGRKQAKSNARRQRHDDRPCEIDADNAVFEVHEDRARNKRRQELALRLAFLLAEDKT